MIWNLWFGISTSFTLPWENCPWVRCKSLPAGVPDFICYAESVQAKLLVSAVIATINTLWRWVRLLRKKRYKKMEKFSSTWNKGERGHAVHKLVATTLFSAGSCTLRTCEVPLSSFWECWGCALMAHTSPPRTTGWEDPSYPLLGTVNSMVETVCKSSLNMSSLLSET